MTADFLVILDAGHGGLNPEGKYTTAPSKQHHHQKGTFHGNGWFYEGVWNRTLVSKVCEKLQALQVPFITLHHPYLDLSLNYRVEKANYYSKLYPRCALVSSHANASENHDARGFEVYTTPGSTRSDVLAEIYWNQTEILLGKEIAMRSDLNDSDHDKESNFQILRNTHMPAILIEHLFFDQFEDATLLFKEETIERFAEVQVRTILEFFSGYTNG